MRCKRKIVLKVFLVNIYLNTKHIDRCIPFIARWILTSKLVMADGMNCVISYIRNLANRSSQKITEASVEEITALCNCHIVISVTCLTAQRLAKVNTITAVWYKDKTWWDRRTECLSCRTSSRMAVLARSLVLFCVLKVRTVYFNIMF